MNCVEREDDFEQRRAHLRAMSDEALHDHFWSLTEKIVAPLVDEARSHTSPSIERSVLLRMGFSSIEAKTLVEAFAERQILARGAGHLVLELAKAQGLSVREAGEALIVGRYWEALTP